MPLTLSIGDVRCFRDRHQIPIKPVTLLVGENSAGKSTVLSMVRAAWDVESLTEPDFNEEPFDLGSYNTIAHYHGGQAKRAQEFHIGATRTGGTTPKDAWCREIKGTFREEAGQPALARWSLVDDEFTIDVEWPQKGKSGAIVSARRRGRSLLETEHFEVPTLDRTRIPGVFLPLERMFFNVKNSGETVRLITEFAPIFRRHPAVRPIASAPIRSRPSRTYDPRRDAREPEGSHVPMTLATLYVSDRERFDAVTKSIAEYGTAAGLFSKLEVKQLGKVGDPFQLTVTVDKYPFNLTDVGYGVSQILPILFDTLSSAVKQTFLLQQPEVHLHPKAQAALGTLVVQQAATSRHTFVIETHSDYLVDRVRTDVRARRGPKPLSHDDVVILYFERKAGRATVTPIYIDAEANLVDVPQGYRQFFIDEERRLLGID